MSRHGKPELRMSQWESVLKVAETGLKGHRNSEWSYCFVHHLLVSKKEASEAYTSSDAQH